MVKPKSDPAGERFRLARLAIFAGGAERAIGVLIGAARIPLLVWDLTIQDYGLYVAVLGVVAPAGLMDFGLHYGLVNAVTRARGQGDDASIRSDVATAFVVYSVIAAIAIVVFLGFTVAAPMQWLLHISATQARLARAIAAIGFGGLLLAMPLRVFPATLTGLQRQHVVSAYRTMAGVMSFAVTCVVVLLWRGKLLPVVVGGTVSDLSCGVLFGLWARRGWVPLHLGSAAPRRARALISSSLVFFATNLANLFRRSSVTVVLSNALGPQGVPAFSVPFALFLIADTLSQLIAGSLWPAYGEAGARGDWAWVRRAFHGASNLVMVLAGWMAVLGATAGDLVVSVWARKAPLPPRGAFLAFAVWLITQAAFASPAILLSGLNRSKLVMWTTLVEGVVVLGLGAACVRTFGVLGIVVPMAGCGALSALFVSVIGVPQATEGNVHVDAGRYLRSAGCLLVSAVLGWLLRSTSAGWPAIVRIAVVAGTVTPLYGGLVWAFALLTEEKARFGAWLAARTRTIRSIA